MTVLEKYAVGFLIAIAGISEIYSFEGIVGFVVFEIVTSIFIFEVILRYAIKSSRLQKNNREIKNKPDAKSRSFISKWGAIFAILMFSILWAPKTASLVNIIALISLIVLISIISASLFIRYFKSSAGPFEYSEVRNDDTAKSRSFRGKRGTICLMSIYSLLSIDGLMVNFFHSKFYWNYLALPIYALVIIILIYKIYLSIKSWPD